MKKRTSEKFRDTPELGHINPGASKDEINRILMNPNLFPPSRPLREGSAAYFSGNPKISAFFSPNPSE